MAFRAFLSLSILFHGLAFAAEGFSGPLSQQSNDHLVDRMAMDLATLSGLGAGNKLEVTTGDGGEKSITIKDKDGRVLHSIAVEYGKDQLAGLPVRFRSSYAGADLTKDWELVLNQVKGLREMYDSVRGDQHPSFDEHVRITMKLDEILNPIKNRIAHFLHETLKAPQARRAEEEASRRQWHAYSLAVQADRRAAWVEWPTLAASIGLIGYSFWNLVRSTVDYYQTQFNPAIGIGIGGVLAVAWFANSFPLISGGDHTFLGGIFAARNEDKEVRKASELYEKEQKEREQLVEAIRLKPPVAFNFGHVSVQLFAGSVTEVQAGAWLVPEFPWEASRRSVGHAVHAAGGKAALDDYDELVKNNGRPFAYGTIHWTSAGQAKGTSNVIHGVSVGAGKWQSSPPSGIRADFTTVKNIFLKSLKGAAARGVKSIAAPLLATGDAGTLRAEVSQQAMLEAIKEFNSSSPTSKIQIIVAIYNDPYTHSALEKRLAEVQQAGIQLEPAFSASPSEICELTLAHEKSFRRPQ